MFRRVNTENRLREERRNEIETECRCCTVFKSGTAMRRRCAFKTYDGDTLNLKSVLCQYVLVVVQKEKEVLDNSYVICEEADQEFLADFLET